MKKILFLLVVLLVAQLLAAQEPMRNIGNRVRNMGRGAASSGNDSLGRRNKFEDSVTVSFRYLDTLRNYKLDSSLNDFSRRYPMPADYYYLGNTGTAAQSFLFSPIMRSGWDAGFHGLDIYKYKVEQARFFTTTRPYSEINYLLGSRSEQIIELVHAQNIRPNWNAHFQYRMISVPGIFKNQKTSHNNYTITNWIQSKNKRYSNYFALVANKLQSTENGGIDSTYNYIDSLLFRNRAYIPTNIGGDGDYSTNFFNTNIKTGNKYSDFNVLMRQHYDFGKKDSLVSDTTVVPLFFPRIRFEHTIKYATYKFAYIDNSPVMSFYQTAYGINNSQQLNNIQDTWKELMNDFSIYTFPDNKNTQQFIKVGATLQNLTGSFDQSSKKYYNLIGHGEYRNRTRNQKWNILASGRIYFAGLNSGDYEVAGSIESTLGRRIGSIKLGVENANKSPIFITDTISSFNFLPANISLRKENISHLYANIYQPLLKLNLTGHYYLVNNYMYYTDYYKINQSSTLFNVLQISAHKVFETGRKKQWKWYADVYFQQVIGNAPVNLPAIFTRNRFGYEGNLGYPKLNIAMGFDTRYRTNYKGNNYSPLLGQFFYQNTETVQYKLPDIAAYVHFRINSFKAFIRAENLNTFRSLKGSFGFTNNNFGAPYYPYPGLLIRVGIFWGFVN